MPTRLDPALHDAYRRAVYAVATEEGPLSLSVDVPSAALDRLLDRLGASSAALLSAANPGSRRLAPEENLERERRLSERLAAAGRRWLDAESHDGAGGWHEAGFFVWGIDETTARTLGLEFTQAAMLWIERGLAPRLVELWGAGRRPGELFETAG